jgi:hypothetical protein
MRDYLFRGKRKDNGEWVYGCLVSISPDEAFILIGITGHIKHDDYECYMVEVVLETVGQYVWRHDVKGVKIFEGDIIYHGESIRFIERRGSNILATRMNKTETIILSFSENPIVIGNIHDVNPAVQDGVSINMKDPNLKSEEAVSNEQATESAAQDQAMEVDSEEGTTEW